MLSLTALALATWASPAQAVAALTGGSGSNADALHTHSGLGGAQLNPDVITSTVTLPVAQLTGDPLPCAIGDIGSCESTAAITAAGVVKQVPCRWT